MRSLLLCCLAVLLLPRPVGAVTATLLENTLYGQVVIANDASGSSSNALDAMSLPYMDAHAASRGGSSAASTYDLSDRGFTVTFDHTVKNPQGYSQSYGSFFFTVDSNVDFVARGAYSASDPDGGRVDLSLHLIRAETYIVFSSDQRSYQTVDESLVLGQSGGDFSNSNLGSLEGTLIAGEVYQLGYAARKFNSSAASHLTTATGFVSLSFIPEPATGALVSLGMVALAWRRRKRIGRAVRI